jgi:hypothetical protein
LDKQSDTMPGFHMNAFGQGLGGLDAFRPHAHPFDGYDRYDARFDNGYDNAAFGQLSGSPTGIQYFPLPPLSPFTGDGGPFGPLPPSPAPSPQWLPAATLKPPLPQVGSPRPTHALSPDRVPSSPATRAMPSPNGVPPSPRFTPLPRPQKFGQAPLRGARVAPDAGARPRESGQVFAPPGCGHALCNRIRHSNPRSKKQAARHTGVLLMSCVRGETATMLTRGPLEKEIGYGLTAGSRALETSDQGCYVVAARRMLQRDAGIPEEVSANRIAFKTFLRLCENSASGTPVVIGFVSERDMLDLAARCPVNEYSATRLFRISYNSARWRNVGDLTERRVSSAVRILAAQISSETMGCS